jgi:hypothetical protein
MNIVLSTFPPKNTQSIKAAIGIAMGYRHFLNDGSAYTVQYSFSSKVGVHRCVSERELTTGTSYNIKTVMLA